MSKIGSKPIAIPGTVTVDIGKDYIFVKGPEGELKISAPKDLEIAKEENKIVIKRKSEAKKIKSFHGLFRQLIQNAVTGVQKQWQKRLEIVGTGYNAKLQGEDLVLRLGYSHPVEFKKIPGIRLQVENNNKVIIIGVDKQLVGQVAYQIKRLKKPDAYKGKGIRYEGEKLKLKPGKKVKTVGAGAA